MPTLFVRVLAPAVETDDGYDIGGEWLILEDDGTARASGVTDYRGFADLMDPGGSWSEAGNEVVIIVPSEFVLGVACEVPGRNVAQIRKALPFVVEEFVASDIEGMHLAHAAIRRDEPVRCNLVDRTLLLNWQGAFAEIGAIPSHILSEAELLPDEADTAYALFDGDHVLIKTGDQAATIDRVNLGFAVGSLTESRLCVVGGVLTEAERKEILDSSTLSIEAQAEPGDSTLGYLARRFRDHQDRVINLLQGQYAPARPSGEGSSVWRTVGLLAAGWAVLAFALQQAQGFWAGQQAERIEADALSLYQGLFPDDKKATPQNLRRRAGARINDPTADGGPGLLAYVNEVAGIMDTSISLNGMSYTAARGELSLDILISDFNRLDSVKEQLEQQRYAVEIVSAQQEQDNRVRARLRLRGQAG